MTKRTVYRCEWQSGRIMFHKLPLKGGEACPAGWHASEEHARTDIAEQLSRTAADMMRAADEVTRDRRGD